MHIAYRGIQCTYTLIPAVNMSQEQKEEKQKHIWCVWIRFILVMTSCSAVHIKTKQLLCSQWELYLYAMTLPGLNHSVLSALHKPKVCLKVFKKIQLVVFSYMFSYTEYGKSNTTARVLLTICFCTSEFYCNLFWKEGCSPIGEIQRYLRNIS